MSDATWHYELDGGKAGPVSLEELRRLRSEGPVTDATLVWREGMADWQAYAEAVPAEGGETPAASRPAGPPPVPTGYSPAMVPAAPAAEEPVREVALRDGFEPRFRSLFGRAWSRFTQTFWPFVGCFALTSVLIGAASYFFVPILFMMFPLLGGLSWYYLKQVRQLPVSIDALFFGFKRRFGDLAILNLIVMLPVFALYILLVIVFVGAVLGFAFATESAGGDSAAVAGSIVGIVIGSCLVMLLGMFAYSAVGAVMNFAILAVLDGGLPWKTALSRSWRAAKPHLWKLTLIYFAAISLAVVGTFALYVGAFILGAWGHLALVMVYEDAFGEDAEGEPTVDADGDGDAPGQG